MQATIGIGQLADRASVGGAGACECGTFEECALFSR